MSDKQLIELAYCNIAYWYPLLVEAGHVSSIATKFIALDPTAAAALQQSEAIIVPDNHPEFAPWQSSDEEGNYETEPNENSPQCEPDVLNNIREQVDDIIEDFGAVFPKVNWFSPKDAAWMSCGGDLKCTTFEQIILLIKSSDACFTALDMSKKIKEVLSDIHANDDACAKSAIPHLVLRRWRALDKSMEFRCFVKAKQLIGICQKDTAFYKFLSENREELLKTIRSFFDTKLKPHFPLQNYVFDIYIYRNKGYLIDISPFDEAYTHPLLFDWEQLISCEPPSQPEFRLIEEPNVVPYFQTRIAGLPYDLLQLAEYQEATQGNLDTDKIVDMLRSQKFE